MKELPRTLPHQPVGQAEAESKRWIFRASHSRIPEIVELCRKSHRRKDDILKTIRLGHSNARLEAFNNKIKVTIRMAYGFRHVDNLIAMIKLRCSAPHPPTNTHPLTHENSRRLENQRTAEVGVVPTICTMAPIGRKSYTHLASSTCMLVHPCDFGVPLAMPAVFHGAPWKPSPWL